MTCKNLFTAVMALFAVGIMLSLASAAVTTSISNDLTRGQDTANITITNTDTLASIAVKVMIDLFEDEDGNTLSLNYPTGELTITPNGNITISASYSGDIDDLFLGKYTTKVKVLNSQTSQILDESKLLTLLNGYCEDGEQRINNKGLKITRLKDLEKDNEDAWEWKPNQNIEIDVKVERISNYKDDDDVDLVIEYGLYDFEDGDFILEESQDFTLDGDDSSDEFTISFQVPSSDIDKDDYQFYVKVLDDDEDEEDMCSDMTGSNLFQDIEITREKHDIELDDIQLTSPIACGTSPDLSLVVSNVGKSDEDKVRVAVTNTALGINKEFVIDDLEKGESKTITIDLPIIAETTQENNYPLSIVVEYDYDNGRYSIRDSAETISMQVQGNCKIAQPAEIIVDQKSAIQSGGKAGQPLVLKATISNPGQVSAFYTIQVNGYDDWATFGSIDQNIFTLEGGASKDILITLNVNKGISGEQTFKIKATSRQGDVTEQPVSVEIKRGLFSFSWPTAGITKDNWYLWGIGLINVILVVLIIVIALRIARSSAQEKNGANEETNNGEMPFNDDKPAKPKAKRTR